VSANILVPELGESVVEARVARWLKKEGDQVSAGEPLVELETDKIDLEVNAMQAGVLAKILHQEGADVKVGDAIGVIDEKAGDGATPPGPATPPTAATDGQDYAAAPAETAAPVGTSRERSTPTAKRVAQAHDVNVATVPASGEAGRVMRRDVESFVTTRGEADARPAAAPAPTPEPSAPAPAAKAPVPAEAPRPAPRPAVPGARTEERVRMSKRRLTIARNLVQAQHTAAMLTTFNEVDMSAVMTLRERRKEAFKTRYGVGLGIASFFVKASLAALRASPRLNAEIQGEEVVLKHYYDIGIAVGAEQGLVVPVIRDADLRSFADIELSIRDFARRANEGTLTLEDLKGGTFTITNGGVFGSLLSTPILNPPQVGILGLHKIEDRPVAAGSQVVVRPMMYVALSYDHRIVDGNEAVQFLVKIKEFVEDPGHLLLES
jgi:2-oxoglutarate dehydrogenase E2 component (dihydrolipoamide succinyltransferase)